jgi:hypothetical protein
MLRVCSINTPVAIPLPFRVSPEARTYEAAPNATVNPTRWRKGGRGGREIIPVAVVGLGAGPWREGRSAGANVDDATRSGCKSHKLNND